MDIIIIKNLDGYKDTKFYKILFYKMYNSNKHLLELIFGEDLLNLYNLNAIFKNIEFNISIDYINSILNENQIREFKNFIIFDIPDYYKSSLFFNLRIF